MKNNGNDHLFSVQFYVKIFLILLFMIFLNVGLAHLPISSGLRISLLLTVASVQAVLVCLFFMELIHEDKFFSFVWGSAVLFMLLFFIISLFELNGRGALDKLETIHYMRSVDKNGNYAPEGPKNKLPAASEEKK
jgi:caa(3)-type oxidase subunit IV